MNRTERIKKDEQIIQFQVNYFKNKYWDGHYCWKKLDSVSALPIGFPCLRWIYYTKKRTGLIKFLNSYYSTKRWKKLDHLLLEYLKLIRETYPHRFLSQDMRRVQGRILKTIHLKRVMIKQKQNKITYAQAIFDYMKSNEYDKIIKLERKRGMKWQI
jgi:hypothetical protein